MTGPQLATFAQEINGGASINATLLFQLINLAKAMVEQRRPWMKLRYTDTSLTTTASTNGWQTAIDLSGITRFNRFYGEFPVKIFDGANRVDRYRLVPSDKRLEYREGAYTAVHDVANEDLYLNGTVNAGTLWLNHIKDSPDIENDDSSSWIFPGWAHPLLVFYAIGINKGGVDFDEINARMAPDNRAQAALIISMLEKWDTELQLSQEQQHDPSGSPDAGFRPNAININA